MSTPTSRVLAVLNDSPLLWDGVPTVIATDLFVLSVSATTRDRAVDDVADLLDSALELMAGASETRELASAVVDAVRKETT